MGFSAALMSLPRSPGDLSVNAEGGFQAGKRWESTALGPSLVAAREGRDTAKAEKADIRHK